MTTHEMLVVGYSNKTLSLLKTRKASKSLAIYLARPLSLLKHWLGTVNWSVGENCHRIEEKK